MTIGKAIGKTIGKTNEKANVLYTLDDRMTNA